MKKRLGAMLLCVGLCAGWTAKALASDDDWQYDPDPAIEKIWLEVNRLLVEVDKVEKKIDMAHRFRASPDMRKRLAEVELHKAQFTLDSRRAVLRTMMQQTK